MPNQPNPYDRWDGSPFGKITKLPAGNRARDPYARSQALPYAFCTQYALVCQVYVQRFRCVRKLLQRVIEEHNLAYNSKRTMKFTSKTQV
ncbi:unnamed protein product [Timema podura]|uniref:Uncharacterized protein n=1 Tax=Timema podura TaxID=61482 RepID=A0ABN7PK63_TIMPD|nr:unnamed protein product [Timema podura]